LAKKNHWMLCDGSLANLNLNYVSI